MTQLAGEYGEALFELAQEEHLLERLDGEVAALDRIFREEKGYVSLLTSRALPVEERLRLLDECLGGNAHPYLVNFIKLLIERGALEYFHECAECYHQKSMEAQGVVEATVTSAEALSETQQARLIKRLSEISGKAVRLHVQLDKDLIGGLRVDMQGRRYDNTIQHRLDLMRRHLADEL